MEIKLVKKSTHWKDQMAGWHNYKITFNCTNCGKQVIDKMMGEITEIRTAYKNNQLCDKCDIKRNTEQINKIVTKANSQ